MRVSVLPQGQKRVLDLLEQELQMIVNHHVGDETQTQVVWKSS